MSVAILVPVLGRPQCVRPLLDSIAAATPKPCRVLFITDPDDEAEIIAIKRARAQFFTLAGGYAQKINAGIAATSERLVFLAADDLVFHRGWLEKARKKISKRIGVVGTNDLIPRRREHTTHFLVSREYAELGCVDASGLLCERYDHSFIDDELIATARSRGAYAYESKAIVEHRHWMNGAAKDDDTYRKGRARFKSDRQIFASRRPLWT